MRLFSACTPFPLISVICTNNNFNLAAIFFRYPRGWVERYYDAFAYRSEEFPGGPAQHPGAYFGAAGYVSNVMVGAARGVDSPMVPVDSCFGGMVRVFAVPCTIVMPCL